jgi:hypothetical protein
MRKTIKVQAGTNLDPPSSVVNTRWGKDLVNAIQHYLSYISSIQQNYDPHTIHNDNNHVLIRMSGMPTYNINGNNDSFIGVSKRYPCFAGYSFSSL